MKFVRCFAFVVIVVSMTVVVLLGVIVVISRCLPPVLDFIGVDRCSWASLIAHILTLYTVGIDFMSWALINTVTFFSRILRCYEYETSEYKPYPKSLIYELIKDLKKNK